MQNYKLFLIVPVGLEELAAREVELKCPASKVALTKGGLELEADLNWIERAHTILKVPVRILLRITDFKVRDFPRLYHKFSTFAWNGYLSHPTPNWVISCSKSRLNHTGRIEETVRSALEEAQKKQPLSRDWEKKKYEPQTFYIRIVDDLLTLSLDLTGEPLYKRGLQTIKGEAPMRENLAAACVMEMFKGINEKVNFVDPMCGSATILTEALTFHVPLHLRSFQFETAPFYKGKLLRTGSEVTPLPIEHAYGFDINEELLGKVKTGLPLTLKPQDSVDSPLNIPGKVLMMCNPPYGERIRIEGKRGSFLKEAWEKFLTVDCPFRFGWILPSDMDDLFRNPKGYRCMTKMHLKNGGLSVTFWIWERII